jgi:hypothetical protein
VLLTEARSFIDFFSMSDGNDKDGQDIIFDAVDDAIVAHPYLIAGTAFEFLIPGRPGIGGQLFNAAIILV